MIVAMAVATTSAMPPMLRWALRRVPLTKAEKERLLREEMEAKGFVPNLERLLLAVDDSPNGKFASRLAGLLAGPRGLPITVLPLSTNGGKDTRSARASEEQSAHREVVEQTAKVAAEDKQARGKEDAPASVDVTVRKGAGKSNIPSGEAVAKEAKKGYDLLFVGLENSHRPGGAFHDDINRVAAAFDRPLAIVVANGDHLKDPIKSPLRILVPVNGTDVSRRAAEVAIAVGRVSDAPITALYVSNLKSGPRKRSGVLRTRSHEQAMAILKDAVDLADRYRKDIRTRVRSDVAPDQAVLAEAARHNLVIMGVNRRPGDELFFGETAAGIFENSPASVVFVAS
jgi:nucleotide-binding universal stress UspA family protein